MSNKKSCPHEFKNSEIQVKRIRNIRRETQSVRRPYVKKSAESIEKHEDSLIDQILLVKLKPREEASELEIAALNGCEAHFLPYIDFAYPSSEGQLSRFPPSLFYPDFTCPWRTDHGRKECGTFTVILTDEKCNRSYAYCYKFRYDDDEVRNQANVLDFDDDLQNPFYFIGNCVLVFVSHYPEESIIMGMAGDSVQDLKRKRKTLQQVCEYNMGILYEDQKKERNINKDFLRIRDQEHESIFNVTPISKSIERLGIETTVYIFLSLLAEKRILVTGENVKIVSDTVQMLSRLLAPLEWPHTLIPIIPDTLIDLVQNPTPYLCGTMRSNLHKLNRIMRASYNITAEEEDITIVDADLGIFSPPLEFNKISKKERLNKLIECGREMGFSKKMIFDLVKFLQGVFPCRDAKKASQKIENRIMIWYAKTFGHYRKWSCPTTLLSAKNKKLFARSHPVPETREFLHWFSESGIFQSFIFGSAEKKKYYDPILARFDVIRKKHAPPAKAPGAKNSARRFMYKMMN